MKVKALQNAIDEAYKKILLVRMHVIQVGI